MSPSKLTEYLKFCVENNFTVLVKGKPGIGKSDIAKQVAEITKRKLLISHPVVSDPTDFKGLPFAKDGKADFLPFGDLRELLETTEPLIWLIDDLGQAPATVQASIMQILLAREINGHKISDLVTIIAATNRKEDKAAVSGLLEPVKSRFRGGIIELEVDHSDWVKWALGNDMPLELIAFIRFFPTIIDEYKPTKDIVNSASPRTVASVGMVQNAGLPEDLEYEVFKGIAGESFAVEYRAFLKTMRELPSVDEIIMHPKTAAVPDSAGGRYAISAALASRANVQNIEPIITYTERLPPEHGLACIKDASFRNQDVKNTRAFIKWTVGKENILL